jgi:cysteine desulfurase
MSRFVYADNAATTRLSDTAFKAMLPYLTEQYGNPSSLYRFGQRAREALEQARGQTAACLSARSEEVFFTSGGTESDNWSIRGVFEALKGRGMHFVTSAVEHHAIFHTMEALKKLGAEITRLPVDGEGRVSPEALRAAIRPDTVLVSVMAANNEIGTVEPIRELAAAAHERGALFHTDAVQAAGHIPIDVSDWGVDLLSLSAHKFGGPRGTGVLYIRKGTPILPLIYGGGQEKGKRSGTENVAGAVGLAAALQEAVQMLPAETARLTTLRDRLISGLLQIPFSRLTGPRENRLPGNASFVFECAEGESILLRLDAAGICASTGSACSSASLEPSHVLLAIGLPHEIAHGSVRLSLGAGTTGEDVNYILEQLPKIIGGLRAMSPLWDVKSDSPKKGA